VRMRAHVARGKGSAERDINSCTTINEIIIKSRTLLMTSTCMTENHARESGSHYEPLW